ncbi:hypothetical protein BHE74_00047960, partial [Ensete ventricosum]
SLTSGSSIHPHLSEVNGANKTSQTLSIIPFTISSTGPELSHNTIVQKDMSNKIDIYHKHMRNNEIYMCQI